jgi:hypothetical protein
MKYRYFANCSTNTRSDALFRCRSINTLPTPSLNYRKPIRFGTFTIHAIEDSGIDRDVKFM